MAGDTAIGAGLFQQRHFDPASLHRKRAARVKTAAGRRIEQARHFTGHDRMTDKIRVGARHGVEQRPRIGMLRIGIDLRFRRRLDVGAAYITATRVETARTTARSCAMNR